MGKEDKLAGNDRSLQLQWPLMAPSNVPSKMAGSTESGGADEQLPQRADRAGQAWWDSACMWPQPFKLELEGKQLANVRPLSALPSRSQHLRGAI